MDEQTQVLLEQDPGAEQFVVVAEALRLEGAHKDALVILMRGLSHSPGNHQGRLLLARVLFECDCVTYAVRELETLCTSFPGHESLFKLYRALSGNEFVLGSNAASTSAVVAESEIDFDAIEELDKENH